MDEDLFRLLLILFDQCLHNNKHNTNHSTDIQTLLEDENRIQKAEKRGRTNIDSDSEKEKRKRKYLHLRHDII